MPPQLADLETLFLQTARLNPVDDDCPLVGFGTPSDLPEALNSTLRRWTTLIDRQLAGLRRGSAAYIDLIERRLFTFEEYETLFDSKIKPENYRNLRVFEYLLINSEAKRNALIANRLAHEKDYFALLVSTAGSLKPFFSLRLAVALPIASLRKHCYVSGRSGSGKSELLKLLFYGLQRRSQDARQFGLILIDPHGDLAREVKNFGLNANHRRLVYFDPYFVNGKTPVLNPLDAPDKSEQALDIQAQELARTFSELMPEAGMSLQMQTILKPCIATLLRLDGKTLSDLQRFMLDDPELVAAGQRSPQPAHRDFFQQVFTKREYALTKHSVFTKIQSLLNSHTFYNLTVGQSTVNLEDCMNNGKVCIFSLAKGKMGTEASEAYGRFLIALIQSAALKRANLPNAARKPVFLFIDEFHNYVSPALETILSESRKFGLHLILSNQTLSQNLPLSLKEAILSNTDVKVAGQNGGGMIQTLAPELGVKQEEFRNLEKHHFFLKTGDAKPLKFQTPDFLVHEHHRYSLSKSGREALNLVIGHSDLYRPLNEPFSPPAPVSPENSPAPPTQPEKKAGRKTKAEPEQEPPKPKFNL